MKDKRILRNKLEAFHSLTAEKHHLWLPVEPVPASRPKYTKSGITYSKRHLEFVETCKGLLWPIRDQLVFGDRPVGISIEFVSTRAKTSKLTYPRYDADNAAKVVLDCLTWSQCWYKDDNQVVTLTATKRFLQDDETIPGIYLIATERPTSLN